MALGSLGLGFGINSRYDEGPNSKMDIESLVKEANDVSDSLAIIAYSKDAKENPDNKDYKMARRLFMRIGDRVDKMRSPYGMFSAGYTCTPIEYLDLEVDIAASKRLLEKFAEK